MSAYNTRRADISIDGANNELLDSHFNYAGQEGIHSSGAIGLQVIDCETAYNNTLAGQTVQHRLGSRRK